MFISILQVLIFTSYVTFIMLKFGIIQSISESWYRLRDLGGIWYSLFTLFCYGLGFLMLFQTNGKIPQFFFLSGAGLCAVGVATMFKLKNDIQPYIHFIGASIGIVFALLGIGFERHNWLPLMVFILSAILLLIFNKKNRSWWIEIIAFITIGLGLLLTS